MSWLLAWSMISLSSSPSIRSRQSHGCRGARLEPLKTFFYFTEFLLLSIDIALASFLWVSFPSSLSPLHVPPSSLLSRPLSPLPPLTSTYQPSFTCMESSQAHPVRPSHANDPPAERKSNFRQQRNKKATSCALWQTWPFSYSWKIKTFSWAFLFLILNGNISFSNDK